MTELRDIQPSRTCLATYLQLELLVHVVITQAQQLGPEGALREAELLAGAEQRHKAGVDASLPKLLGVTDDRAPAKLAIVEVVGVFTQHMKCTEMTRVRVHDHNLYRTDMHGGLPNAV